MLQKIKSGRVSKGETTNNGRRFMNKKKTIGSNYNYQQQKRSNTMLRLASGKSKKDLKTMKNEKKHLLDDSVRFSGKQIDPYSTQNKWEANFYRAVLLKDAKIIPESREIEDDDRTELNKMF